MRHESAEGGIFDSMRGRAAGEPTVARRAVVQLIVYYVVFMIAGDIAAYLLGLIVEREFGSQVSLIVFLTLYFLFLWVSWLLAVWMTEPKRVQPAGTA
jgi:cation transporter-like permease